MAGNAFTPEHESAITTERVLWIVGKQDHPRGHEPGTQDMGADVLTVGEGAALLRIGRNALYDAIGRGEVPHRRIGKSIRLSRTELLRWLAGTGRAA